ncbi:hypothetical protein [Streptomyces sp. TRM75563]|uniref:hypothetical protein n=1 Tax=Streptomyces sp. TRM75563 TaxID=2817418 RepID=UPI001F622AD8|nr:hypothetical protein [Streptomyces sp. TRM75563]MCI4045420.1 hypothetical protein [Streptomyces sp. TRM75563]
MPRLGFGQRSPRPTIGPGPGPEDPENDHWGPAWEDHDTPFRRRLYEKLTTAGLEYAAAAAAAGGHRCSAGRSTAGATSSAVVSCAGGPVSERCFNRLKASAESPPDTSCTAASYEAAVQLKRSATTFGSHHLPRLARTRSKRHTVPWTLFGDWKKPGEKSSVKCGFSSFLRSVKVETKK